MLSFAALWVFLLLPIPWLIRIGLPPSRKQAPSIRVPFGDRLNQVLKEDRLEEQSLWKMRLVVPSLVWLCVLTATARPQWILPPLTKEQPTRDLLLLVDLSASMDRKDFTNQAGKQVTRLTALKEVLSDFLEHRKGDRVGLVVFGDAAYLQAPFSTDIALSRELLEECEVGMAGPKTAFGDAIGLGVSLFDESQAPAKTIIALTDGNDTKSGVPPVEAARVAASRNITIHTVAIGDPTTVGEDKLDEQALKDVADATGGSYFFAADREHLSEVYTEIDKIETHQVKTLSYRPRVEVFYIPMLIGLLLSMLQCTIPAVRVRRDSDAAKPTPEIEVNPLTGELEVVT
ncbi:vWA domain-containing protein [Thalassoglobus sp.]|uniref:vWA domain-containing protein n=1 Tax=Thalassoglobus sp. TaxID=2795869 RepID=UPI003AA80B4E